MKARWLAIVTAGLMLAIPEARGEAAAPKTSPASLRPQVLLKGQEDLRPNSLAFSPDSKMLASLEGEKGIVRLWNVAEGKSAAVVRHRRYVSQAVFSPDGKMMATCGDRRINLWDAASHKNLATIPVGWVINSIQFTADGKTLVAVEGKWLSLWSVEKKEEVRSRKIAVWPVLLPAYPAIKKPLLVVCTEPRRRFTLIDAVTGETALACEGHERPIVSFAMDQEGKTVASADELAVRLRDRETGANVATVEHLPDSIFSPVLRPNGRNVACALSPDGKILACVYEYQIPKGPRRGGFRLYEIPSGKLLADTPQPAGITSLVFSPDGRLLATGLGKDIDLWTIPAAWRKKDK